MRFGVREICDVVFYDLTDNKPALFMDTLKMSSLETNATTVYAVGGKGNNRLLGWDSTRTVTMNIQDALLNPEALAAQLGTDLVKHTVSNKAQIHKREVLKAIADGAGKSKVTVAQTPLAGTGVVYLSVDGKTHTEEVATFTLTAKDFGFADTDVAVGAQVVVYYQYEVEQGETIVIDSKQFAGYYKVVGDTTFKDEGTGDDIPVQIVIPKAKISSEFKIEMKPEGDPSVFDFKLDVFKPADSTEMVKIIRY